MWAGSANKNVGVEPLRRVQHEFVGVLEVGISTLLAAIWEMHGRCNFPVESHQFVCAPVKTRRDARISFVYSDLPGRVSIVKEMQADSERLPFSRLLKEKRSDIKSAVCVLTCGNKPC